jgi:hypothetical protein
MTQQTRRRLPTPMGSFVLRGREGVCILCLVIAGLDPAIHHLAKARMGARVTSAFTPVCDGLCAGARRGSKEF